MIELDLPDEEATTALGGLIARIEGPLKVYLSGDLGSGKTTLARALLQALGVQGRIKSPTYALVEPYQIASKSAYHIDLYRLNGTPRELEELGLRELIFEDGWLLLEWPERAQGFLPEPDLWIHLSPHQQGRRSQINGRQLIKLSYLINKPS